MRKILLIFSLLVSIVATPQAFNYENGWAFNLTEIPNVNVFASAMTVDYLSRNEHISDFYSEQITTYLGEVLSDNYQMPNDSINFANRFYDEENSNWFEVYRMFDTLYQSILNIPNTGSTLEWYIEDSTYYEDSVPNHKMTSTGFMLLVSEDYFSGVNGTVYIGATNFTGEFPNIKWPFSRLFANSNTFFGTFPNITNTSCTRININNNFFSDVEGLDGILTSSFQQFLASNNDLTESAIDRIFLDLYTFWVTDANTPSQNVTIDVSGGTNATPSTQSLTYITDIEAEFDATAYTITITTN